MTGLHSRTRRPAHVLAAVAFAAALTVGADAKETKEQGASQTRAATQDAVRLANAAPSVDALIAQFLEALEHKDKDKIRALRVTQSEYLDVILPGSVDAGRPPRQYDHHDQGSQYFWSILDTKSVYTEANIIAGWGGEPLKLKSVKYRKGTKDYAGYRAYKQLSLFVERKDGMEDELRIGSIAEVNGQYKFISYVRD